MSYFFKWPMGGGSQWSCQIDTYEELVDQIIDGSIYNPRLWRWLENGCPKPRFGLAPAEEGFATVWEDQEFTDEQYEHLRLRLRFKFSGKK